MLQSFSSELSAAQAQVPISRKHLFVTAFLVIAAVAPFFMPGYYLFLVSTGLIYAVALLGLNILTGYNGQISIGHGAFMAVGGYGAAFLMQYAGWPYWATLPAVGVVCLGLGYLFGFPALRLGGFHLALATFALAVALPQVLRWKYVEHWTGGVQGIVLNKPRAPSWVPLSDDQWLYAFTLCVTAIMFVIGWNLIRGRVGRALVAIRDQPIAASAMGINVAQYKSIAFGISAMYTGIAGALGAILVQYVSPDSYGFYLSVSLLTGIVCGGLGSIFGAFFGAAFIVLIPNIAESISKAAPWAIYGMFMIATVYFFPSGAVGVFNKLAERIENWKRPTSRGPK